MNFESTGKNDQNFSKLPFIVATFMVEKYPDTPFFTTAVFLCVPIKKLSTKQLLITFYFVINQIIE